MIERLRIDGFVRNFEIELRTKDGRLIPHLFSATVANIAGEPCVIAIVHDISPLKQTERELIAAREALSAQVNALGETRSACAPRSPSAKWHSAVCRKANRRCAGYSRPASTLSR